ncbi:hypothetical protein FOXB_17537 [Fusarium oxysporum f. sp. conglutinans Fo5176]|uniref:Uncharacterized protein n=1 Tax=Fusarium oxysporum (strain Fo5176) TaxID=660025 RepID=F9GFV3_FUSOF|nr:hypothetical protein FOXB_17537 [Fusarium oxysporum f. sp. conglutinans Fo5176]
MDGVRAMSESISPGFSLPVLVQVRDLLSGTQKVSDPGRRMEGLGKDKGRPKDRARAPTVAVTGSGGGRRRSASVAASGGGAIAVYSSASREIGKDEAREIFTANVELNQNVTQQSSDLSSPSAGTFWTHRWSVRNEDRARRSQETKDNLNKQKQRREPSLAPAVELLE